MFPTALQLDVEATLRWTAAGLQPAHINDPIDFQPAEDGSHLQ
jgi:hypothetical protein